MEIYKAKYDTPCGKCKKQIIVNRVFFKVDNSIYCVKCIQEYIDVELVKLQNKLLDFKNIQGKAYMMEKDYNKNIMPQPEIKVS